MPRPAGPPPCGPRRGPPAGWSPRAPAAACSAPERPSRPSSGPPPSPVAGPPAWVPARTTVERMMEQLRLPINATKTCCSPAGATDGVPRVSVLGEAAHHPLLMRSRRVLVRESGNGTTWCCAANVWRRVILGNAQARLLRDLPQDQPQAAEPLRSGMSRSAERPRGRHR